MKELYINNHYQKKNSAEMPLSILFVLGNIGAITIFHYYFVHLFLPGISESKSWNFVLVLNLLLAIHIAVLAVIAYKVMPVFMLKPSRDQYAEQSITRIPEIQNVLVTEHERLHGYLLPGEDHQKVLVYFGGIDETAAGNMKRFYQEKKNGTLNVDCDIAIIDWPQYGKSSGKASVETMKQAAVDIVSYFQPRYSFVVLAGYSMGSGYAVYADSVCGCDDLILFAPYAHSKDLYNGKVNVFHGVFQGLLSYKLPVAMYASKISKIPLIFASENDRRVTGKTTLELAESFQNGAQLVLFRELTHSEIATDENILLLLSKRIQNS